MDIQTVEPRAWIEETLAGLVLDAPENRLADFQGQPIFDRPVIGIADGDSPLFQEFRRAVSARHLAPREILQRHASREADLGCVRVVAWALPFTTPIRESNRVREWPSRLYSLARNNGAALNDAVHRRLTEALHEAGYAAVAPIATAEYDAFRCPERAFTSTWSERHVAYAAGLGQFGLNGALITPAGIHVRLGSVVTNLPVEPLPVCESYAAACLSERGAPCGRCMERCPVGAISPEGLDKNRCHAMRQAVRERFLETYVAALRMLPAPVVKGGERKPGYSLGCALCQCGVPCEGRFPEFLIRKVRRHA